MTEFTHEIRDGLNLALNEAIILGLDFHETNKTVYVTFSPIAIQQNGTIPSDNRFLFAFKNVGRLAASLTLEPDTKAIKFEPIELADKLSEFKNESLYGWDFIDNNEELVFNQWKDNKSFDIVIRNDFLNQHTIDLFQGDKYSKKSIDLRIWFDQIEIFDNEILPFDILKFIQNGKRGWDKISESGWTTKESELKGKLKSRE